MPQHMGRYANTRLIIRGVSSGRRASMDIRLGPDGVQVAQAHPRLRRQLIAYHAEVKARVRVSVVARWASWAARAACLLTVLRRNHRAEARRESPDTWARAWQSRRSGRNLRADRRVRVARRNALSSRLSGRRAPRRRRPHIHELTPGLRLDWGRSPGPLASKEYACYFLCRRPISYPRVRVPRG